MFILVRSVFALFFAWVGIILGLAFLAFSIRHYDHVVMRNSSRELSTLTWLGVMICHLNTIIIFHSFPSDSMCSLIRWVILHVTTHSHVRDLSQVKSLLFICLSGGATVTEGRGCLISQFEIGRRRGREE